MRVDPERAASRLTVFEDDAFRDVKVIMAKSMPPQFSLSMSREMPTPGWEFEIDTLDIDPQEGRIRVALTEVGPEGMVAQVISKAHLRIPLGFVEKGRYVLELHVRRGSSGEHQLAQTFVVSAW